MKTNRVSRKNNWTRRILAVLLAVSMTVQQGSFVLASDDAAVTAEQAAEAEAKAKAESEAAAKAAEEKAAAEAKAKAEAEAKAKAEAEAKAKAESEQKAKEESEAKAKAESEQKAKEESEAKAKAESEAAAKAAAEAAAAEEAAKNKEDQPAETAPETEAAETESKDTNNLNNADNAHEDESADQSESEFESIEETEEKERPVKITINIVEGNDESNVIEGYSSVSLPEFDETLSLSDSPYKKDVTTAVRVENTSRLYVTKYDYAYATINGSRIKTLRRAAVENGFTYSFSTDGTHFTQIEKDTILFLHYNEQTQKLREYDYTDHKNIHVHAYINDPSAIPDSADLVVTPITKGAAYDAYMQALNNQSSEIAAQQGEEEANTFDASNTLLYDIAFLAPKADDEGNAIPNEFVEIKPDTDQVRITFEFLKNQLTEKLDAENADDITVIHLPVKDSVTADADKIVDLRTINPNAIKADVVNQQTANIDGVDTVEFVANGFSVFSITKDVHRGFGDTNITVKFELEDGSTPAFDTGDKNYYVLGVMSNLTKGDGSSWNLKFISLKNVSGHVNATGITYGKTTADVNVYSYTATDNEASISIPSASGTKDFIVDGDTWADFGSDLHFGETTFDVDLIECSSDSPSPKSVYY